VAGSCEQGNESSGSIDRGEFTDQLSDYEIFNMTVLQRGNYRSTTSEEKVHRHKRQPMDAT
jgi:hypothetical protein